MARAPELLVRTETPEDARRLTVLVQATGRSVRHLQEEGATTLEVPGDCSWAADLNRLAMANGIALVHLSERRSTLEEAFFEITRCAREGAQEGPAGTPPDLGHERRSRADRASRP